MAYDRRLMPCFGERDLNFATRPPDKQQAFELLTALRKERAHWLGVRDQMREFLTEQGAGKEHIAGQLAKAARLLKPWLHAD
jgi:hypothetical protein